MLLFLAHRDIVYVENMESKMRNDADWSRRQTTWPLVIPQITIPISQPAMR